MCSKCTDKKNHVRCRFLVSKENTQLHPGSASEGKHAVTSKFSIRRETRTYIQNIAVRLTFLITKKMFKFWCHNNLSFNLKDIWDECHCRCLFLDSISKKSSLSLFVVNSSVCTDVWLLIAFYGTNFKRDGSIFNMNATYTTYNSLYIALWFIF